MYAHPGKKLLFMGNELGQEGEWDHAEELEWGALEKKPNRGLGWLLQDLNRLYRKQPPFYAEDFKPAGFEWLEVDNSEESIIAFLRKARDPRYDLPPKKWTPGYAAWSSACSGVRYPRAEWSR
jgi:1,4-alpha-glucan branching enzyme